MAPKRGLSFGVLIVAALLAVGGALLWYWPAVRSFQETDLESNSATTQRLHAVEAQVQKGAAAVPALIEQLSSEASRERCDAAMGLGWIGEEAKDAVPALLVAIDDPDPAACQHVLSALGRIGADISPVIERIAQKLSGDSNDVRDAAANLLVAAGDIAIPEVRPLIFHSNVATRALAVSTLQKLYADDPETLDALREFLNSPDQACQSLEAALMTILRSGRATRDDLRIALHSGNTALIYTAVGAVSQQQPPDAELIADLVSLATNRARLVPLCETSADVILHPSANATIPAVALQCLSQMGPMAIGAGNEGELLSFVFDDLSNQSLKRDAILALCRLGTDGRPLIPHLVRLAVFRHAFERDDFLEPEVRWSRSLREIAPKEIPAVIESLRAQVRRSDESPGRALLALQLLGELGPESNVAVPDMLPLLEIPGTPLCKMTLYTIVKLGPAAGSAVPTISSLLDQSLEPYASEAERKEKPRHDSLEILQAIEKIGPGAGEMRSRLLALEESSSLPKAAHQGDREHLSAFRFSLLKSLAAIGGADEVVVRGMREFASHPVHRVSAPAIEFLLERDPDRDQPVALLVAWLERLAELDPRKQQPLPIGVPFGPAIEFGQGTNFWYGAADRSLFGQLIELGERGAPCILPLARAVENPLLAERSQLLLALPALVRSQGEWSADDPIVREVVPRMIEHVSSGEPPFPYVATNVIEAFGPAAREAIPAVEAALARETDPARLRREVFKSGRRPARAGEPAIMTGVFPYVFSETYSTLLRRTLDRIAPAAAPQGPD